MQRLMVAIALGTVGCGGGADNGQRACQILVDCNDMTQATCDQSWGILELSSECVEAMGAVDCQEHASAAPSYLDTCFPPCSGVKYECRGGSMLICEMGRRMVARCAAVCLAKGGSYTGTCGLSYQNQVATHPVCWCEMK